MRILYAYLFPPSSLHTYMGTKGDWDLRISDLVKNSDETDI